MVKKILSFALSVALCVPVLSSVSNAIDEGNSIVASAENYNMKASYKTIDLIKTCEGFAPMAYWDYKQWTIGYGTYVESDTTYPNGITEEQACEILYDALEYYEDCLNSFLKRHSITVNQDQFDALLCFTYNFPAWTFSGNEDYSLAQMMINGYQNYSDKQIYDIFGLYVKAGSGENKKTLPGLVRRRVMEASLFLYGNTTTQVPLDGNSSQNDTQQSETVTTTQAVTTATTTADETSTQTTTQSDMTWLVTDKSGVNIRADHSTSSDQVGFILYYNNFKVTEIVQDGGYTWGKVSYEGTDGWVALDFCSQIETAKYDIDGDGMFTLADISSVQLYINNQGDLTEQEKVNADVNQDGKVDIQDFTTLFTYYASYIL
ncbi:MAG: glycoside hydrolase family protein [Oscillospiraceae bacterium]